MHINEAVHMNPVICCTPRIAEFMQCVRPEGREQHQAAGFKYSTKLLENHGRVIHPLQHQVGEHQVHGRVRQRQLRGIGAHRVVTTEPRLALAGGDNHRLSKIERYDMRLAEPV